MGGGIFSVLDMRTDSMKTTFEIDCIITAGGGFLFSYSSTILSTSFFSPTTWAVPFRFICAMEGLYAIVKTNGTSRDPSVCFSTLTRLMFVLICIGGMGFLMSRNLSAEMFAIATLTFIILNQRKSPVWAIFLLLSTFVSGEAAVAACVSVAVIGHKVADAASLACWAQSSHLAPFYFV